MTISQSHAERLATTLQLLPMIGIFSLHNLIANGSENLSHYKIIFSYCLFFQQRTFTVPNFFKTSLTPVSILDDQMSFLVNIVKLSTVSTGGNW